MGKMPHFCGLGLFMKQLCSKKHFWHFFTEDGAFFRSVGLATLHLGRERERRKCIKLGRVPIVRLLSKAAPFWVKMKNPALAIFISVAAISALAAAEGRRRPIKHQGRDEKGFCHSQQGFKHYFLKVLHYSIHYQKCNTYTNTLLQEICNGNTLTLQFCTGSDVLKSKLWRSEKCLA